ncbi:heme peroxidase [Cristinia sonorae]|uniref:Peroxidase n=1 Tax=Cristinia sonorae TaxID=1940300 RepID=A0A8K0UIJ6_9AGAR|nr:heme peroxidase [Cristinia sonorae]
MAENTWPNRLLYELDSQLYDREGYNARNLPVAMRPDCSFFFFGDSPGRSNAADWIRTAYHDMATHNSAEGSGGLDASIRFETGRPENAGTGFNNTLIFIRPLANRYFSLSDDIALAAVTAIEMCGGPKIPFRGGRVDATEANIAGVPEPQQSLDEHIANFARQGFSHEEMISLTACGHTFGGIQHSAFPDIAPPSSDSRNTDGNAPFDTTFAHFDNKIATDYLDGTTANPLVIGHNVTTRSDLRIFSSDGNETMSKFTNPAVFKETCTNLFSRMINAVPNSVTLTDVIEPIKFKPVAVQLVWIGDGNLRLQGEVRVWDSTPSEIRLKWKTKNGDTASQSAILVHNPDHTTKPLIPDSPSLTSQWFDFPPILINATESVSKFWFEVKNSDGSVTVEDLDGTGYPIQDAVLITKNSCVSFATGTTKFIVNFAVSH